MRHAPLLLALVSVSIAAAGLARALEAATELARVNNKVITLEDFTKRYHQSARFFEANKPPTRKVVLDEVIKRELAIQEAQKMGLDRDPDVRDQMDTLLYHALLNKKLAKEIEQINVSNDEAKAYYERNPQLRTSHIFVACPWDARPEQEKAARAKIDRIYNEAIRPGKVGFAEIAQKYSEGPTAAMGGDLRFQGKGDLDPTYYQTALHLKRGEVSPVIRSQFGFHIVKLTDKLPWEEADHGATKRLVIEEHRDQIYERYMASLRSQAKVTVHSELLKD